MRIKVILAATLMGGCLLVVGCGASREKLAVVAVSNRTPAGLATLLRRPVRVPKHCQLTKPVHLKRWGYALGQQPLLAIIDSRRNSANLIFPPGSYHGWWGTKVLWAEPSADYRGWLLVRGVGLDGSQMGFQGADNRPRSALEFHAGSPQPGQSGLFWSTGTLIPHGGCYAYQVDGRDFSYSIVFQAHR